MEILKRRTLVLCLLMMKCFCDVGAKKVGSVLKFGNPVDFSKGQIGCGFYFNQDEAEAVREAVEEGVNVTDFPVCEHNLICRVGVSRGQFSNGHVYFACDVRPPNKKCDRFVWAEPPKEAKKTKAVPLWTPPSKKEVKGKGKKLPTTCVNVSVPVSPPKEEEVEEEEEEEEEEMPDVFG